MQILTLEDRNPEMGEEQVYGNISRLKELRGYNRVLDNALKMERGFGDEVHDLFYYFMEPFGYLKVLARVPGMRKNHNQRLEEINEVLDGVNLASDYHEKIYSDCLDVINGLKGQVNTRQLREEELSEYLGNLSRPGIEHPFIFLSIGSAIVYNNITLGADIISVLSSAIPSLFISLILYMKEKPYFEPVSFNVLNYKSHMMDKFISDYRNQI